LIANALMRAAQRGVRFEYSSTTVRQWRAMSNFWHSRAGEYRHTRFQSMAISRAQSTPSGTEFLFSRTRLDYRMHNKLFVVDGSSLSSASQHRRSILSGRPESQFATMTCSRLERPSMDWRAPSIAIGTASLP